jgi:hypothetical protein
MFHRSNRLLLLAVVGCFTLASGLFAQDKDLTKKLEGKVTLDKGIDANTPLKDALEFMADKFDLTIVLNSKAFNGVGVQKVEEQPVSLKPVKNEPLGKVLQKLLDPVQATYKTEKGKVVIIPKPQK